MEKKEQTLDELNKKLRESWDSLKFDTQQMPQNHLCMIHWIHF